ncbi:Wzz/FepE/Etk N-terminal domain-containing protein [Halocella sp. SP3-1]|uniref:YveK family protein n=1 Tax=Halocella sp. SP3-1 TaxID=2382161 RepID=UPI000F75DFAC|nr:Wzz/FepE/Etk N-terminal domain-containing protein [Halocella sp. SP3-1]AZO93484.1 hypothetical protein D7D81_02105 [Halocella sp. SP3-1]
MEERNYYDEYEIDLREYILLLWRRKWIIATFLMVFVLAAGIYSFFLIEPVYQSNMVIQLNNIDGVYSEPSTVIQIIKSNKFFKPIMDELNLSYTNNELKSYISGNINITNIKDTNIIRITVNNTDPVIAKKILEKINHRFNQEANGYYDKIINNKKEQLSSLNNELNDIEKNINSIDKEITEINSLSTENPVTISLISSSLTSKLDSYLNQKSETMDKIADLKEEILTYYPIMILDTPVLLDSPIRPNKKLNIAIAGVLGLMLGVFTVFFVEFMKEEDKVETAQSDGV